MLSMRRRGLVTLVGALFLVAGMSTVFAGDVVAPSAKGPQWQNWNPNKNEDVGDPAFKVISSNPMTLYYGFRGAVVFERGTNQWQRVRMVTITRHKVEGFVNQVNDKLALAAGLHEIAVYDAAKHKWVVLENVTPDDSTGVLAQNFILTPDYATVKQLGGPSYKYTSAAGWQKQAK
jgi:hypothetical protein